MCGKATLVIGPTCVGKSTFISQRESDYSRVRLAHELNSYPLDSSTSFVHYNLLFDAMSEPCVQHSRPLGAEPVLKRLLVEARIQAVVVLVAPISTLISRARQRDEVEPVLRASTKGAFPREQAERALLTVDLFRRYEECFAMLETAAIPYRCVYAGGIVEDGRVAFPEIDRLFAHAVLKGRPFRLPAESEIEEVLRMPGMEYQVVEFPFGMVSSVGVHSHIGRSRGPSFDIVFSASNLTGASVLDVGCAVGDFLFRAERRGATTLVGLEPKADRYRAAQAASMLLCSQAEVFNLSLEQYLSTSAVVRPVERFDWVLALNVLHHVSDLHGFMQGLATQVEGRLVLEYPSLRDPSWLQDNGLEQSEVSGIERLPLVGVGSRSLDQTYVFSDAAIESLAFRSRTGLTLDGVCDSPVAGRRLAILTRQ